MVFLWTTIPMLCRHVGGRLLWGWNCLVIWINRQNRNRIVCIIVWPVNKPKRGDWLWPFIQSPCIAQYELTSISFECSRDQNIVVVIVVSVVDGKEVLVSLGILFEYYAYMVAIIWSVWMCGQLLNSNVAVRLPFPLSVGPFSKILSNVW